ncbi:uncharacterized protein LOC119187140 [Rhipicephalus microplus]|uniref:uncharacterized protein LOC119187140 n=1 Tax=Rhipicephalus microplus TaxID=6941 RepID=UPI003F6D759D
MHDKDALQLFRNNPDRSHGKKCLLTCDLCSMNFMKLNALLQHHVKEHSFKEKVESVVFRTTMEFYTWKDNKERQTGSSFTVSTGKLQWMAVDVKPAFYCHHPRNFEGAPMDQRLRRKKTQGSCKIGQRCLESLKAREKDGKILVTFQKKKHIMAMVKMMLNTKGSLVQKLKCLQVS